MKNSSKIFNMDAGNKRNLAGEQVHEPIAQLKREGLRNGFWSAGFANQKIQQDFWAPKINYFRGNGKRFWS